ncbi:hypothetical protein O3M35_008956 [Rhynocoris fuscipes]|uniref:Hpc2-related domain-containing protein n=1 Tax=Rhynocoris fuscipes TaxID=488301 RepID=A0AAW1D2L8_9HEMI
MSSSSGTKTVRLTIDLKAYSKNGCAILNYKDLVANAVKNSNTKGEKKEDTPEEKKYRRSFAELGAGYDESDSFIDNTEVEESVPEEVITEFYVNSKKLKGHKRRYNIEE